jgi:hypothetical protein
MNTTIIVEKRNHRGVKVHQYSGEIIDRGDAWVCLRAVFDKLESNLGFVTFRRGDVFMEWFFSDRWYNIFQVHDGDSARIKGWYCNITRPAQIEDGYVCADDLELDIFVFPNGTVALLDEAEFSALDLPTEERMEALRAIQTIRRDVAERTPPFDGVR